MSIRPLWARVFETHCGHGGLQEIWQIKKTTFPVLFYWEEKTPKLSKTELLLFSVLVNKSVTFLEACLNLFILTNQQVLFFKAGKGNITLSHNTLISYYDYHNRFIKLACMQCNKNKIKYSRNRVKLLFPRCKDRCILASHTVLSLFVFPFSSQAGVQKTERLLVGRKSKSKFTCSWSWPERWRRSYFFCSAVIFYKYSSMTTWWKTHPVCLCNSSKLRFTHFSLGILTFSNTIQFTDVWLQLI